MGALIRDREREAAAAAPGGEAGDSEKPRRRRQVSPFKHLNVTQFISDHATLSWIAENSTFTCTYRDHEMSNHLINRPHGTKFIVEEQKCLCSPTNFMLPLFPQMGNK